jgi:hypothetical protein
MKKLLLIITAFIVLSASGKPTSLPENKNVFQYLRKDVLTGNAVLIIRVKSLNNKGYNQGYAGGEVLFNYNQVAYSFPLVTEQKYSTASKTTGITETVTYCLARPGEYELLLANLDKRSGNNVISTAYDFRGSFSLEAGKVYYLGEFLFDLQTNNCRLNLATNDQQLNGTFKENYPVIFKAAEETVIPVSLGTALPWPVSTALFNDEFSPVSDKWLFDSDPAHETYTADGRLTINKLRADSSLVTMPTELPDNFEIRADAYFMAGDNNKSFGLLIGNEPKRCLKFSITGSGYFAITRWDYGKGVLAKKETMYSPELVVKWTKSELINTTSGAANSIRVQKIPWYGHTVGVIAFYINDKLAARSIYYVSPPVLGGAIQFMPKGVTGFYAYGRQAVCFDNFRISELKHGE